MPVLFVFAGATHYCNVSSKKDQFHLFSPQPEKVPKVGEGRGSEHGIIY